MSIHIYTYSSEPWEDIVELAEAAGYDLTHIAGHILISSFGEDGGPFGVFRNGELLARFNNPVDRDKWLHKILYRGVAPLPVDLLDQAHELVGDVEVDLDTPLEGDVAI